MVGVALFLPALVSVGFYLSWRATRLDRLHHRVETSWAALDAALLRRGAAVLELVAAGVLPPNTCRALSEAATAVRRVDAGERELAESRLSRLLRSELDRPGLPERARPYLQEVAGTGKGLHMARTFHNDAVAETRRARRSRLVRGLRLAGHAALPDFFEMDDHPPRPDPGGAARAGPEPGQGGTAPGTGPGGGGIAGPGTGVTGVNTGPGEAPEKPGG